MNICTLNKIAACGTARFDAAKYTVTEDLSTATGVMVRSAAMHDMELPDSLLAIARAGAGVNNIPVDKCSETGVVVFNTPGANANAVKELVIAGLLISSRKVISGIEWAKTLQGQEGVAKLVEKGKSAFVGPEIKGKKLGVIGLGAIGILVANAAHSLGMEVYGYDPYLSVDAAWGLSRSIIHATSLDQIYANCDYITVHVPLTPDTKGMFNAAAFAAMPDGDSQLLPRRPGQHPGYEGGPGLRQGGRVCGGLPHRGYPGRGKRHRHSPPGRLHPRERGQLRRHGR